MKLKIQKLDAGENSLDLSSETTKSLTELRDELKRCGHPFTTELTLKGVLTNLHPDYFLRASIGFTVERTCDRCVELFSQDVKHSFETGLIHVGEAARSKAEQSEGPDLYYFSGFELDLVPIIKEQFLLSLPFQALCTVTCLGLCQSCGKNLNLSPCGCKATTHSPFGILKSFKMEGKETWEFQRKKDHT